MMLKNLSVLAAIHVVSLFLAGPVRSQSNANGLSPQLYEERRDMLMQTLGDSSALVVLSAPQRLREWDSEYEYNPDSDFFYFKIRGAEDVSFPSIVGSGPNSTSPHYWENRRKMQDGDVVVLDVGADLHCYAADVTRTIPVSGKFSPAQREILEHRCAHRR